jgi:anthranilate/para-aminobenzoate synthase component I
VVAHRIPTVRNVLLHYLAPSTERLQQIATRNSDFESTEGLNHYHQCALPLRTISVRVDVLQEESSQELDSFTCQKEYYERLPFEFLGGYVAMNLRLSVVHSTNRHKSQAPDACFFLADRLISIDHCTDDVYILSLIPSVELQNRMDMRNIQRKNDSTRISLNGSPENHQCFF